MNNNSPLTDADYIDITLSSGETLSLIINELKYNEATCTVEVETGVEVVAKSTWSGAL